jgi:hypothetical protein
MKPRRFPITRALAFLACGGLLPASGCLSDDFWQSTWEGMARNTLNTVVNSVVIERLDQALSPAPPN